MAKRPRARKAAAPVVVQVKPREFKAAIADASRLKKQAADYQGFASRGQTAFCKKTGFPPKIFGWLRGLNDMDDTVKREHVIREFLFGCEMMGWLDQGDLFDDLRAKVQALREAEDEPAAPNGSGPGLPLDEAQRRFEEAARANPPPNAANGSAEDEAADKPAEKRKRGAKAERPADAVDEIAGATAH
jgi:hypothetical protein